MSRTHDMRSWAVVGLDQLLQRGPYEGVDLGYRPLSRSAQPDRAADPGQGLAAPALRLARWEWPPGGKGGAYGQNGAGGAEAALACR